MRIGFTGTQIGMSDRQKREFAKHFVDLEGNEFHHGDCVGADEQADRMVRSYRENVRFVDIHIHPPDNPVKQAFCAVPGTDVVWDPAPYLERNHDIVDNSDILIAAPKDENREELRSGTWATIRYARKKGKRVILLPR